MVPGAGWNRKRIKAREVSQGEGSLRGGPGKLQVRPIWISVNEDFHVI